MTDKPKGEYIEDITEAEPKARDYGDKQSLVAGEQDKSKYDKE